MLESGYVKVFRSMLQWEWYEDINTKVVFLHFLLTVNYEDKKWRGKIIKRGQRAVSFQKLSKEVNLTLQQTRTAIKHLTSTGELTYEKHTECCIFTLPNYEKFQASTCQSTDEQQVNNTQLNTCLTDEQQASNTYERKIKKDKKDKKEEVESASSQKAENISYITVQNLHNTICQSYSRCLKLSDTRKKAIKARFNTGYKIEDFQKLFEKAEASDFLKGKNKNNWSASFDWLIKDANMAKVLDGNYDNKSSSGTKEQQSYDISDLDSLAVNLR